MPRLLLFILTILWTTHVVGQQYPVISNYLTAHYGFNPATTGTISNSHLHLLYRTQWVGFEDAPQTQLAAYRKKLLGTPIALGGYIFNDEAGVFQRSGGMFLSSYTHQLEENAFLSIGLSAGYQNLRLQQDYSARDQNDLSLINAPNGQWHPDLNAGIFLQLKDFYLGFSAPQLLANAIQFDEAQFSNRLQRHYFVVTGYRFQVSDNLLVEPSTLIKIAEGFNPQIEASLKLELYNNFWLGTTYRTDDAIVALAGFTFARNFDIAYAYELTTSPLRNVSSGSHEISLAYRFGKAKDSDQDGIADHEDQCPDLAGPEQTKGCPEDIFAQFEKRDADSDGIVDELDNCPKTPGPKENNGCPWTDKDRDGIRDALDLCPEIVGVSSNKGCPEDDRDQDGIRDDVDQCPDVPGSFITKGCPDTDTDKDGLRDAYDNCPYTFGPPSNGGCPVVTDRENSILEAVKQNLYFNTGEYEILAASQLQLIELASLLKERADWQLRIAGHTDNKGAASANLEISRKRAEAVRDFLVSQGIPSEQIIVEYYGETQPIRSNETESGRRRNRRVELDFIFD